MSLQRIPRGFLYAGLILVIMAMIPPALIARQRAITRELPRIHLMQDMSIQHRFQAQQPNPMFRDGRAMRPVVAGTVAQGELLEDDHFYYRGVEGEAWVTTLPPQITADTAFMRRGQDRYSIFCQVCHGTAGFGDGPVNERALLLQSGAVNATTWVPATNLHEPRILDMPVGEIYHYITHGVRNMPAYGPMIPIEDRWAIAAYAKALQRSQNAQIQAAGEQPGGAIDDEPMNEPEVRP